MLLLFHLSAAESDIGEFAFVQYMEVTKPISKQESTMGCVCLRWATDDELDRKTDIARYLEQDTIDVAQWYDVVPLSTIIGKVHVVRANMGIPPLTEQLLWTLHRLYINRFHRSNDPEAQLEQEEED